jgi:hypothetical protein
MLVGAPDLIIDFVIGQNQTDLMQACNWIGQCLELHASATTSDYIIKSNLTLLHSNPLTYRLNLEFTPN